MKVRFFLNQNADWTCEIIDDPTNNLLSCWLQQFDSLDGLANGLYAISWGIRQSSPPSLFDSSQNLDCQFGLNSITIWEHDAEELYSSPGEDSITLTHAQAIRLVTYWYDYTQGRLGKTFELDLEDWFWPKFLDTDGDEKKALIKAEWIKEGRKWPER
jgi:hypothetical protein